MISPILLRERSCTAQKLAKLLQIVSMLLLLLVIFTMLSFRLFALLFRASVFVNAINYPVGITNCGESKWVNATPIRAVTLNQGATEVLLALNLTDKMVGTSYLDDEIWPELADRYSLVPVLSDFYPDVDTLKNVSPDFLYAAYSSAFSQDNINYTAWLGATCSNISDAGVFCRKELHEFGIQTYLQSTYCEKVEHREESKISTLFAEIWDLANIFDAHEQAREVIDSIDAHFDKAVAITESFNGSTPTKVLWVDGLDNTTVYAGACCGAIGLTLKYAGANNIFDDLGREDLLNWAGASWEEVVEKDPDVLVVEDVSWSPADQKLYDLCRFNITRNLRAVQNRAFIVVPFSGSTLGVKVGATAYNLAEAMGAITRNEILSNVEFTHVNLTADGDTGGQGVGGSGVRVYTRLPVFNSTDGLIDLETFCPGKSNIVIGEKKVSNEVEAKGNEESTNSSSIPKWSIGLLSVLGVGLFVFAFVLGMVIYNEKKGKPYFAPEQIKSDDAISC